MSCGVAGEATANDGDGQQANRLQPQALPRGAGLTLDGEVEGLAGQRNLQLVVTRQSGKPSRNRTGPPALNSQQATLNSLSRRHGAVKSPAEIRRGGVGERVGAGGADEIGQGSPVQQLRRGLDGAAPGLGPRFAENLACWVPLAETGVAGYLPFMPTGTSVAHIKLDEAGRPWVDDTNVKVIEIVLDHVSYGWSAETIHENHPHLSLAQVYAALAWYYDHQPEMDQEIEQQGERIRQLREQAAPSPLKRRVAERLRRGA